MVASISLQALLEHAIEQHDITNEERRDSASKIGSDTELNAYTLAM